MNQPDESIGTSAEPQAVEKLLTKRDVAARLRKTTRTVETWMAIGHIPYYKIGRSVLFRWSDVESFLDANYRVCAGGHGDSANGRGADK